MSQLGLSDAVVLWHLNVLFYKFKSRNYEISEIYIRPTLIPLLLYRCFIKVGAQTISHVTLTQKLIFIFQFEGKYIEVKFGPKENIYIQIEAPAFVKYISCGNFWWGGPIWAHKLSCARILNQYLQDVG